MAKKTIEVFKTKKSSKSRGGCGCNCDCNSEPSLTLSELVQRFSDKYGDVGEFKVYELTRENKNEYINRLNEVLANSGERLVIKESNLNFVLPKIDPVIALDGKIISVKNYPDENQLYQAVTTGKKIPMKPSCC